MSSKEKIDSIKANAEAEISEIDNHEKLKEDTLDLKESFGNVKHDELDDLLENLSTDEKIKLGSLDNENIEESIREEISNDENSEDDNFVAYEIYLKKAEEVLNKHYGKVVSKLVFDAFIREVEQNDIEFQSEEHLIYLFESYGYAETCGFNSKNKEKVEKINSEKEDYFSHSSSSTTNEKKKFDFYTQTKQILKGRYGKDILDEVIVAFHQKLAEEGITLISFEQVIHLFEKFGYAKKYVYNTEFEEMKESHLIKEEKETDFEEEKNAENSDSVSNEQIDAKFSKSDDLKKHAKDLLLDENYFEILLSVVEQMNYLRLLLSNIENIKNKGEWGDNVQVKRNGIVKEIPSFYYPFYQSYRAQLKNLKNKMNEEVEEISSEKESLFDVQYSKFKNISHATTIADQNLEEEKFQGKDSIEEIYEKICLLEKQKNKSDNTIKKIKIYKNKLQRLSKNKHIMYAMKWKSFWSSSVILNKLGEKIKSISSYQFLTFEPVKFMKSKDISDEIKEQIVSDAIHLFNDVSENEFIENHKRELKRFQKLLFKKREKSLKIVKKRNPLNKRILRKKVKKTSKNISLNIIEQSFNNFINLKSFQLWKSELYKNVAFMNSAILERELVRVNYFLENNEHLLRLCGGNYNDFQSLIFSLQELRSTLEFQLNEKSQNETNHR